MARIFNDITELIGNTPLVRLKRIGKSGQTEILAKLEFFNPMGSVKDRIGLSMIERAEKDGRLHEGSVLIEPTSGNTGIALAFIGAAKGYRVILVLPEDVSQERKTMLRCLGAEVVETPADQVMRGAILKAEELARQIPGAIILQQFENPANPEAHRRSTAEEIWKDTDGQVDIFVAGVGTGGTLTGVAEVLKSRNPNIRIIAVEPSASPVISGGKPSAHKIQGIGAGFIPKNLNTDVIDEVVQITDEESFAMARRMAREEGIFCGISSGASITAASKLAERPENAGKMIVAMVCSFGERYLENFNEYERKLNKIP